MRGEVPVRIGDIESRGLQRGPQCACKFDKRQRNDTAAGPENPVVMPEAELIQRQIESFGVHIPGRGLQIRQSFDRHIADESEGQVDGFTPRRFSAGLCGEGIGDG